MREEKRELRPELGQAERDFVFAVTMKIVKCECDAEDVTQDALLLAHRHRDSFLGQSKYSTWLYRIATTTALMHLRRRARKRREISTSELADSEAQWLAALKSERPSPELQTACREELERVGEHIADLGSKYIELLRLRWFEGYSEREISGLLDLPLSTVKTRSFRGRRHVLSECALAA